MNHIMLDLETMGNTSTAAIIAIGAVHFDSKKIVDRFYTIVSLQSSVDAGMTMDASTVLWWLKQSDGAREEIAQSCEVPLADALGMFAAWLPGHSCIWGNGAGFDNVILANAYRLTKKRQPWSYRNDRCYRTIAATHPEIPRQPHGTSHNALDDATGQALHLQSIWATMEERPHKTARYIH